MADILHFVEKPYNLRNNSIMQRQANRTVYFGTESISSYAPNLYELIPSEIKSAKSLNIFKEKIKSWTTDIVGFIKRMLEILASFSSVLKR